jgi:hypothetical protein
MRTLPLLPPFRPLFLALCGASLSVAALPAQGLTLPVGADLVEQAGRIRIGETLPLTPTGRRLLQICYDPSELAGVPAQTWNSLELRPDAVGIAAAASVQITVWLSATGAPAPRAMSFFDRTVNRGSDRAQVVWPRTLSLPQVPPRGDGRPQAGIPVAFDRPFNWPGQSGLLLEIEWERVGSWVPGVQDFDARRDVRTPWRLDQQVVSHGCVGVGSFRFAASTSRRDEDLVLTAEYQGAGIDTTASVLLALAGPLVNLPLGRFGAPGCVLGNDPAMLVVPSLFSAPGGGSFWTAFQLPYDPSMLGGRVLGQAWVAKPGINALGVAFSETVELTVTQAPGIRRAQILVFESPAGGANQWITDLAPVVTFR